MIYPHSKDKLPDLTTSMVCSRSANYIGRTIRQLATWVKEHKPPWLGSGSIKTLSSAIVTHLAETGHTADVQDCFKILYQVPPNHFEDSSSTDPGNSRGDRHKAIQTNSVLTEKVCQSPKASMAWHANLSWFHPKFARRLEWVLHNSS